MNGSVSVADKLGKLIPLLASPLDGEALGAARGIGRVLSGAGLTFHDLVAALDFENSRPAEPQPRRPKAPPKPSRSQLFNVATWIVKNPEASADEQRAANTVLWRLSSSTDDLDLSAIARLLRAHDRLSGTVA